MSRWIGSHDILSSAEKNEDFSKCLFVASFILSSLGCAGFFFVPDGNPHFLVPAAVFFVSLVSTAGSFYAAKHYGLLADKASDDLNKWNVMLRGNRK